MAYAELDDVRLYYELSGPVDTPVILQFGGGLFGRHNFGLVNDGFRERFRCSRSMRAATARRATRGRSTRSRGGPATAPRCSTRSGSTASSSTARRWAG
jgi:hypothetical protein